MTRRAGRGAPADPTTDLLVVILTDHQSLPDALCRGQAPRFDRDALDGETEAQHAQRLTEARDVCGRCPERQRCTVPILRARVTGADEA